ncbi:MAG: hypothetical protein RR281_06375, partial [Pseudoflavonifractor sp.]
LMISGGSAESMQAQLAEGNRILELIAHMNTRTVLVEGDDPAASAALTAEGWSLWSSNVAEPTSTYSSAYVGALLKSVEAKRNFARIALPDSALTATALPQFLRALEEENYALRLALETEL